MKRMRDVMKERKDERKKKWERKKMKERKNEWKEKWKKRDEKVKLKFLEWRSWYHEICQERYNVDD